MRERSEHSANEWLANTPQPGRLVARPKRESKPRKTLRLFVCLAAFAIIGAMLASHI